MRRILLLATTVLAAGCAPQRAAVSPSPVPTATATEPAPRYEQPQASQAVRDGQEKLRQLRFYDGPIDGLAGPDTTAAVARYQRAHGLTVNGRFDAATADELRAEPRHAAAPAAAIQLSDRHAVQDMQARLRQLGFYHGAVDGTWGPGTQAALERFQQVRGLDVTGQPTQATLAALGMHPTTQTASAAGAGAPLDPAVVRTIQERLRRLGFYSGRIDGIWGARAQAAVERFQGSRGLQPTGELNPTTLTALGLDPNNLSASTGGRYGMSGSSVPR